MKNVTITMDERVAQWARIEAAKRELSLSKFVGELLREKMAQDDAYQRAYRVWLAIDRGGGGSAGKGLPTREEIDDRPICRKPDS